MWFAAGSSQKKTNWVLQKFAEFAEVKKNKNGVTKYKRWYCCCCCWWASSSSSSSISSKHHGGGWKFGGCNSSSGGVADGVVVVVVVSWKFGRRDHHHNHLTKLPTPPPPFFGLCSPIFQRQTQKLMQISTLHNFPETNPKNLCNFTRFDR